MDLFSDANRLWRFWSWVFDPSLILVLFFFSFYKLLFQPLFFASNANPTPMYVFWCIADRSSFEHDYLITAAPVK